MFSSTLIKVPEWGSVSLLEVIWVWIGLVSLIFSAVMLRVYIAGLIATPREMLEWTAALQYVRREVVRLLTSVLIAFSGAYGFAMGTKPGDNYITVYGLIVTISIYLIALGTLIQSFGDYLARHKILNDLKERGLLNGNGVAAQTPPKREEM